jgi:hypothetical protein
MESETAQYWKLFQPIVEDESTWSHQLKEHIERDLGGNNYKRQLSITNEDVSSFIYPHKSYLEMKFQIVKNADASDYVATDNVSMICGAQSLFNQVQYLINGTIVEAVDENAHVANFLRGMMDFSDDYSRTAGTQFFWYPDSSSGTANKTEFGAHADGAAARNPTYNIGYAQRYAVNGESSLVHVFIPLAHLFPFVAQVNRVFIGSNHKLIFNRTPDDEFIFRSGGDAAKVKMSAMSWWCPVLTPSLKISAEIEQQLVKKTQTDLYWESVQVRTVEGITNGQTSINAHITTLASRPTKVVCLLRKNANRNDQTTNPYNFKPTRLSAASLSVGSKTFPDPEYTFDFTGNNPDMGRLFAAILKTSKKGLDFDTGSQLNAANIKNLYGFITFDLEELEPGLFKQPQALTFKARFSGAGVDGASHLIVCMFHETEAKLNIQDRRMTVLH